MVMSKRVWEARQESMMPVGALEVIPTTDRWHTKSGKWNAAGIRIRTAIMEYLDKQECDATYSDIKNHLCKVLPDDCVEKDDEGNIVWQMNNTDVKGLVATLVAEDKVVDN